MKVDVPCWYSAGKEVEEGNHPGAVAKLRLVGVGNVVVKRWRWVSPEVVVGKTVGLLLIS